MSGRFRVISQICIGRKRAKGETRTEATRTVNPSIAVLISLADHLIDLFVCKFFANRGHDMTELCGRDKPIVIAVKNLHGLAKVLGMMEARLYPIYLEGLADFFF